MAWHTREARKLSLAGLPLGIPYDPPDFTKPDETRDEETQKKLDAAEQRAFFAALSSVKIPANN